MVVQERISPNIIFCFNPNECIYHAEYDSIAHRVATLKIKVKKFGSTPFKVTLAGLDLEIPIIILWRALGGEDDEYNFILDPQTTKTSEEDAIVAETKESAMKFLSGFVEDPQSLLDRRVYPNIDPSLKCSIPKWKIYIDCLKKDQYNRLSKKKETSPYHDRDHVRAKRLDTAGAMLGTMFSHLFYQMLGNIRKMRYFTY